MEFVYNSLKNKNPVGPSLVGAGVTYTVKVSRHNQCENVSLVLLDDSGVDEAKKIRMPLLSRDTEYLTYQVTVNYKKDGLFWYYFELSHGEHTWFLCKTSTFDAEPLPNIAESYAQIVYKKPSIANKQYNSGIIYHVFVDRFKRTGEVSPRKGMILRNDWGGSITKNTTDFLVINKECFGGNIPGIIEKLEYIKSLGTSTIMLSPIFESSSYHKYDTADLENVDSMYGGNQALKDLVKEAKKLGMSVLLDGVFNHVGSDSIYFNKLGTYDSLGAYQSKKSKYYDWFVFHNYPDDYCSWWGFDTLPQFNESNASLQKFVAGPGGVIEKHMKTGILGFRLDVADELIDPFLDKISAAIRKQKPDAVVMGEVWEDASTKLAYGKRRAYFSGKQLNSVMNYPIKNGILDFVLHRNAEGLASILYMLKDHYPREVVKNLMNFLGTHDTKRILTILREHNELQAENMLKIATALMYCSPGVPAVFYGDEVGVTGGDAPFSRVCFPWGKEDEATLEWYRKLGELRSKELLANGDYNVLFAHNGVFIMERTDGKNRLIVAANCSHEDFKLNFESEMTDFETGKTVQGSTLIKSYGFAILSCATIPTKNRR